MFDKIKQLQQMKGQVGAAKERLNTISVRGESQGVTVVCNGNRKVLEVIISDETYNTAGREQIAELILIATNRGLENAEGVFEAEMKGMAGGMMGGLGLF